MSQHKLPRLRLLALAIVQLGAIPATLPAAYAAEPTSAAVQRSYDIPSGPLEAALNRFGREAGILLSFPTGLTAGRQSPGLQGSHTASSGLARLLQGTGLAAEALGDGSYTLYKVPAASEETTLKPVTVTENFSGTTEGTGSYTQTGPSSTATGLGMTLRETPQSVTVITRQQMDDQGLTSVPDVLEKTTGITVGRSDSERFTFYSRGYSVENFQFDGIPNTVTSAIAFTSALADSAIYDRVEVVRGATGLLTGAGYPSAVVNLVRKKPTREFAASIEGGIGSWNRRRVVADVSGPINESSSVRGRLVAAGQNADSFTDYYSRDTRNLYAIIEADLTPNTLVSLGLDYMKTEAQGSSFGHIPLFYSDGSRTNFSRSWNPAARWSYWNNSSRNVFATLNHEFGSGWTLDVSASHLSQERDVLYGTAYNGTIDRDTGAGIRMLSGKIPVQADTNTFNAKLSGPYELLGRSHELVLSASYSRQRRDAQNVASVWTTIDNYFAWDGNIAQPSFTRTTDRHTEITEKGVSLATRLRPAQRLSIILGARTNWYELLDETVALSTGNRTVLDDLNIDRKITPYAGIVYDIDEQWSAYASVTDIFQPQTYYKDAEGSPLAPLTGRTHEVGLKAELLDRKINTSLALFHIRQDNAPQYVGSNGGEEIYTAIEGITSRGVEAEFSGSLTPSWNVHGGYTYRTSKAPKQPDVVSNAVNTNQPRHLFKLSTSYRLLGDWSRWTVGGNLTWQSKTYYQQASSPYWRAYQPTYAVVGLMARYAFSSQLTATLNVNNVFDKTYMPGLGAYGTGMYGDPRNALLTVRYAF